MPFGDGTGPVGTGPGTGRGRGYCSSFSGSVFVSPAFRRGMGGLMSPRDSAFGCFGRGRGRCQYRATGMPGWARSAYRSAPSRESVYPNDFGFMEKAEMETLKNEAEFLRRQLDAVERRISNMEKMASESETQ